MLHCRSFLAVIALSAISMTTGAASAHHAPLFVRAERTDASTAARARATTSEIAASSSETLTTPTTTTRQEPSAAKSTVSASKTASFTHKVSSAASSKSGSSVYSHSGIATYPATASHATGPSPTSTLSNHFAGKSPSVLSVGLIVGIAMGGAVLFCLVVGLLASRRHKKRKQLYKTRMMKPDPFTMGFGSHDPEPPLNVSAPHVAYNMAPLASMVQIPPATLASPNLPPASTPTTVTTTTTLDPSHNHTSSIGTFTVLSTYTPTLSDELDIQTGDKVEIFTEYDDGWCQGANLSRGAVKGVFPKHCVDYQKQHHPLPLSADMKRVSSMYIT